METAGSRYLGKILSASAGNFIVGMVYLRPSQVILHAPVSQCSRTLAYDCACCWIPYLREKRKWPSAPTLTLKKGKRGKDHGRKPWEKRMCALASVLWKLTMWWSACQVKTLKFISVYDLRTVLNRNYTNLKRVEWLYHSSLRIRLSSPKSHQKVFSRLFDGEDNLNGRESDSLQPVCS